MLLNKFQRLKKSKTLHYFQILLILFFFYSCTNPIEEGSTGTVGQEELVYTLPEGHQLFRAYSSPHNGELLINSTSNELILYSKKGDKEEKRFLGTMPIGVSSNIYLVIGGNKVALNKSGILYIYDIESKTLVSNRVNAARLKWSSSGKYLVALQWRENSKIVLIKIDPETASYDSVYADNSQGSRFDFNPEKNIYVYSNEIYNDHEWSYFVKRVNIETGEIDSFNTNGNFYNLQVSNSGDKVIVDYSNSNPTVFDLETKNRLYDLQVNGDSFLWNNDDSIILVSSRDRYSILSEDGVLIKSDTLRSHGRGWLSHLVFGENEDNVLLAELNYKVNSLFLKENKAKQEKLLYKSYKEEIQFSQYYKNDIIFATRDSVFFYNLHTKDFISQQLGRTLYGSICYTAETFIYTGGPSSLDGIYSFTIVNHEPIKLSSLDMGRLINIKKINDDGLFSVTNEDSLSWVFQLTNDGIELVNTYNLNTRNPIWAPQNSVLREDFGDYLYGGGFVLIPKTGKYYNIHHNPQIPVYGWDHKGLSLFYEGFRSIMKKQVLYVAE